MTEPVLTPPPAPIPPAKQPNGCMRVFSRAVGIGLTVILSAALAVAGTLAAAWYLFGYSWDMPTQYVQSQHTIATVESEQAAMRTAVTDLSNGNRDIRNSLEALQADAAEVKALAGQLRESVAAAATVQAQANTFRVEFGTVATVQAQRAQQMDELVRRTDRLTRFLDRLSDLSQDASADLGQEPTPAPAPPVPPIAPPTTTVAPLPEPNTLPTPTVAKGG